MNRLFFGLLLLLLACQEQHDFSFEQNFSKALWAYDDPVITSFEISDTSNFYQIGLDLTHGKSFNYQNLYIQIGTDYPNSPAKTQTLSFDLADKSGNWYGKCRSDVCRVRVILQEKAKFFEAGQHTFTIYPHMRQDPVQAIHSFALFIDKQ